ncbi:MAG: hypothetical protein KDA31_05605 [Phycisphaerales bacterium]|nr:hypothetical protein [Phycisphaerales bacterium]MCB9835756.1 hypothetical protein [Phycisphaera sp.]
MFKRTTVLTLAAGSLLAGSASAQESLGSIPPGSLNGRAAIDHFADQLDEIALRNETTTAELVSMLRRDLSTYITPGGLVFNVCPLAPDEPDSPNGDGPPLARGGISLDDFLNLESNPGAPKTIYLDFDGHHSVSNGWGHNITFPAWDRSNDPSEFTDSERDEIIKHWQEVVEDFAVFSNINITTKDPGTAALIRSGSSDQEYGIRVVMTQITDGFGQGTGGIALLNSFDDSIDNPCFVFNKALRAGPQTASHETGHTLGLQHDGLNGATYHPGSTGGAPTWGPIMGAPFGRQLVQWSRGDYPGASSSQLDFDVMTRSSNGVTLAPDDHPNQLSSGTPLFSDTPIAGLITTNTDTDAFSFVATGGDVAIDVSTVDVGRNIDLKFTLYRDAPFQLIEEVSPTGTWLASQSYPALPAGGYTVVVDGTFENKPSGAVSDYGSVGTYTITMTETPPVTCLADANGDGVLSPADFSAWVAAFNTMSPVCDQNADGMCTPADFSAWVANYNAGCP